MDGTAEQIHGLMHTQEVEGTASTSGGSIVRGNRNVALRCPERKSLSDTTRSNEATHRLQAALCASTRAATGDSVGLPWLHCLGNTRLEPAIARPSADMGMQGTRNIGDVAAGGRQKHPALRGIFPAQDWTLRQPAKVLCRHDRVVHGSTRHRSTPNSAPRRSGIPSRASRRSSFPSSGR